MISDSAWAYYVATIIYERLPAVNSVNVSCLCADVQKILWFCCDVDWFSITGRRVSDRDPVIVLLAQNAVSHISYRSMQKSTVKMLSVPQCVEEWCRSLNAISG